MATMNVCAFQQICNMFAWWMLISPTYVSIAVWWNYLMIVLAMLAVRWYVVGVSRYSFWYLAFTLRPDSTSDIDMHAYVMYLHQQPITDIVPHSNVLVLLIFSCTLASCLLFVPWSWFGLLNFYPRNPNKDNLRSFNFKWAVIKNMDQIGT